MHMVMKKSVFFFAASAALVLSSCTTKEIESVPQYGSRIVEFTASSVDTRTVFGTPDGSTYPVLWSDNDAQIGLSLNLKGDILKADLSVSADHKTATFASEVTDDGSGMYQFAVVNPWAAFKSVNASESRIMVEIPSGQTSGAGTPDEKAQVMYGVSEISGELPSKVSLNLKHVPVYLHMSFANADLGGATVQSVSVSSEKNIAGRFYMKLDGSYVEGNTMLKSISVTTDQLDDVWCAIAPEDLSGSALTLAVVTDQGSLRKTLTVPAGKSFTSGKIFRFTVDMSGVKLMPPVIYKQVTSESDLHVGDEIIIVAQDDEVAISTAQNTNNRSAAGITKDGDLIKDPSESIEVFVLEDGVIPGHYAFRATSAQAPGYIYAANASSASGNYMRTKDTMDAAASWSVTFDSEGTAQIFADITGKNWMRYNHDSNLFSAYATTSSQLNTLIYRKDVPASTSPRLKVTCDADGSTLASGAGIISVNIFSNVSWTASATGGASVDQASGSGNAVLSVSIPENTGASVKSYKVTVSTSASVSPSSYEFNISQNPYVSIAEDEVLFSESFAKAAKGDTPSAYQASGDVSTYVFGGSSVVYTESGAGTKFYDDGLVYVKNGFDGDTSGANMMNLMVPKGGGWFKISGIPCPGVKTATLVFRGNYQTGPTVSTSTEGVTVGDNEQTDYQSNWEKKVYVKQFVITFADDFAGGTFDLTFLNSNASNNNRMTDIEITVTELK